MDGGREKDIEIKNQHGTTRGQILNNDGLVNERVVQFGSGASARARKNITQGLHGCCENGSSLLSLPWFTDAPQMAYVAPHGGQAIFFVL